MTNLISPAPGDRIAADHLDQFTTLLNAALGLTVRSQTALGRIELPSSASNPSSPANYQAWMRSDLGIGGRAHMRHSNGQNVPYLPVRQLTDVQTISATITGTSFADVGGASVSITPTGGYLVAMVVGTDALFPSWLITGDGSRSDANVQLVVGGTTLKYANLGSPTASLSLYIHSLPIWYFKPAAGVAITVKLQAEVTHSGISMVCQGGFLVMEIGD